MLIYTRRAPPKEPKRRSRAVKKKYTQSVLHPSICNEKRPQCDRCTEKNTKCEYEAVKPRKRRRTSFAGSALSNESISPTFYDGRWPGLYERDYNEYDTRDDYHGVHEWRGSSGYQCSESESTTDLEVPPREEHEVEEIVRVEPTAPPASNTSLVQSRSQYPDLAMIAPSPIASPLLDFSAPVYMEFTEGRSRRALVDHFCNVLSHLIVFKEDNGNPFRQLVLPLSHASSPVMNAIFALSSAHLEYRGIEIEEKSLTFHNRALQGLAQLIDQNDEERREEVLGAIVLLVYYEVLVQRGSSNMVTGHLKGAMTIMKAGPQVTSPTSLFLERAFRFYDVIAALSHGTPPNTTTQPCASPFPSSSGPESPLSSVDTLLGLSTDLWPIIHRLSHLLSFKNSIEVAIAAGETSKAAVLRTELENASQAIELALTTWKPTMKPGSIEEEEEKSPQDAANKCAMGSARMQSILNNAEAYRNSALVYLYRTIHSHPRNHPLVQNHAHLSLLACSIVVKCAENCHNGPMSALLWPLFVASCEAITEEDRGMALSSFVGTERRQGMNNIMRTWEVVREVWHRADLGQEEVDWRDICAERGFNIVLG
ncbi:L-arabinose-responsive transcription regulator [Lachnellula hyalina]|uniref:L-arabinose-responsive transcription regulator n=1 Tax=Lachnellula hyalina TaxID=1316788 RepID=A0A8H8R8A5_9HELO|nr:L-arabinose-responsive transcription regulator [Lachnellula hyalina]TVY29867.1 L-arabinose-responsive transcription regulator [Lachnellula hyalina]